MTSLLLTERSAIHVARTVGLPSTVRTSLRESARVLEPFTRSLSIMTSCTLVSLEQDGQGSASLD